MRAKIKQYEILLLIVFAAFVGGGTGAFSKIGLQTMTPITFMFLRFVTASALLLPIVFIREKKLKFFNLKSLFFVSLLSVANVTLYIFGVARTTATISLTLYAAMPLISAVILFVLYKDRLSPRKEFGLLVGFSGVLTIILLPLMGKSSPNSGTLIGNLLVFAGVFCASLYFVLSKNLQKYYSPLVLTASFVVLTVIIQGLLLPLDSSNLISFSHLNFSSYISVLYVGLLGTGLYYVVYQYAVKKATPVIAGLTLYLQPVFGAVWASVLLGEKLTVGFVVGAILALIGVYIVTDTGKANGGVLIEE